ncbi:hypothetical protein ANO11243_057020 [Dothideomycetidae sp. 11243]|nr:hypothetical protein ANO11243_057020 [fungal sp. No.11243]
MSPSQYTDSATQTEHTNQADAFAPPAYDSINDINPGKPPWECRWKKKVTLQDGTQTTFIIWRRSSTLRCDYGYSYTAGAEQPEYYIACRPQLIPPVRDSMAEALKSHLKHRKSAGCRCSLVDLAASQYGLNVMNAQKKRRWVMQEAPELDGIPHFSAEPSGGGLSPCTDRFLGKLRYHFRVFDIIFELDQHHKSCECAGVGRYEYDQRPVAGASAGARAESSEKGT